MKKDEYAVIINADDFGQTESCTRAIYEAFQKGLITDTTMVANGEAMELAFAMAPEMRGHIGAHLNLTEGPALTPAMRKNAKFVSNGRFTDYFKTRSNYFRRLSPQDKQDIYEELTAQMERLIAGGIELTHADSHHHIHWNWMLAPIFFSGLPGAWHLPREMSQECPGQIQAVEWAVCPHLWDTAEAERLPQPGAF